MCLSRAQVPQLTVCLTPDRPLTAGFRGPGCTSKEAVTSAEARRRPGPLRFRLVTLGSALELLEHVGGTQLLATIDQLPVTQRDRPYGRTGREGCAPWCRLPRKSGVFGA